MAQWILSKREHLKWVEHLLHWRGLRCVNRRRGLTGTSSSSTKQAEVCIWANPRPQYGLGPILQSSSAKRDPEMGCNVNETQQCALVAKVANSVLPSISRIATSRDSKVNSPFHFDAPGVLWTGLVFPLLHISMWKPIYNIQFPHKGFCAETKYIYIMKPHQEKDRFRKLVGVPNWHSDPLLCDATQFLKHYPSSSPCCSPLSSKLDKGSSLSTFLPPK